MNSEMAVNSASAMLRRPVEDLRTLPTEEERELILATTTVEDFDPS
jgi:hypothetical protein